MSGPTSGDRGSRVVETEDDHVGLDAIIESIQALRAPLTRQLLSRVERRRQASRGEIMLSSPQHLALVELSDGPLTISELARQTGVAVSTATRMAQGLGRLGLVDPLDVSAGDRRLRHVAISTSGRRAMEAETAAQAGRVRALLLRLTPGQRSAVLRGVEALHIALADEACSSQEGPTDEDEPPR
jgi:DNA-binding MarR family transcriptional regulator